MLTRPPADHTPRRRPPATSGLLASNGHRASASTPPADDPPGRAAGGAPLPDLSDRGLELLTRLERLEAREARIVAAIRIRDERIDQLERALAALRDAIGYDDAGMSLAEWVDVIESHAIEALRHADRFAGRQ